MFERDGSCSNWNGAYEHFKMAICYDEEGKKQHNQLLMCDARAPAAAVISRTTTRSTNLR